MALKAIEVTEDNRSRLEERYASEEGEFKDYEGSYLVVSFGEDVMRPEGFLTSIKTLEEMYTKGAELKNGFFEVIKK